MGWRPEAWKEVGLRAVSRSWELCFRACRSPPRGRAAPTVPPQALAAAMPVLNVLSRWGLHRPSASLSCPRPCSLAVAPVLVAWNV